MDDCTRTSDEEGGRKKGTERMQNGCCCYWIERGKGEIEGKVGVRVNE